MNEQPAVEEEGLPAPVAHERLPGAVDEHVTLELGVVGVAFAALLADERFLSSVEADVPLQVVVKAEAGSTDVAGEGFLSSVDQAVSLQSRARPVRLVAQRADEGRDAGVFPLVHSEGVGVLKGLFAHRAFILPVTCVNHLMEAQGVFTLELFPTGGAAERPVLRVHDHVSLQLHRQLKGLLTKLALQHHLPLLVSLHVVFESRFCSECFPTLLTGERLWRSSPLVTLEVVLQRLLSPERPLTLRAGEGQRSFYRLMA